MKNDGHENCLYPHMAWQQKISPNCKWAIEKIWLILTPAHSSAIDSELADARPRLVKSKCLWMSS